MNPLQGVGLASGSDRAWPHCIDELGSSNKLCSQSLERFVSACAGTDRNAVQVLPFIK